MMQIGVQGAFGVIPAHLNELSPDAVRSLFPGFVYQLGVLLASPATAVEFMLRDHFGYPWALTMFEAGDDRPDDRDLLVWPGGTRSQLPARDGVRSTARSAMRFGAAQCQEKAMNERRIGIIMNGVTGRMGLNQHLVRSILAIRKQGGVALSDGSRLMPDPILVGRNAVEAGADRQGTWGGALDHGSARRARQSGRLDLLRRAVDHAARPQRGERRLQPASISIARSRSPSIRRRRCAWRPRPRLRA